MSATGLGAPRSCSSVIAGKPTGDDTGGRLASTNPARLDDVVAEVALGSADTFVTACRAAKAAQADWAVVPAPVRGRVIAEIGRIVEANKEALARLVTREVGKPYGESLGEVQEIIDTCDFFLGEGRRLYGETVPSEMHDKALFTFRMPVGVMAAITAGNFPVAVPSWYVIPALLCGNAVVWKPAEYSAAVSTALFECFAHGGLPDGVLNLVLADGAATYAGLEAALGARPRRQGRLHRLLRRRQRDRRALRPARAVGLPRARREEPDGRRARRRPRARRRGRGLLWLRDGRAAVHLARHRHRARGPP